MNKAKLKSYAPQARKDFIAAVTARANLLGLSEKAGKLEVAISQPQGDATVIAGQAWPVKVHSQRQQLITRIQKDGFSQTMEAVAYTWFNRFAALRYMELHDYLSHGHRALSSLEGTLPDILTHAADLAQIGAGDGGLPGLKPALVTEMKLAGNRDGELYSMLLVAQCNALSNVMPFLFERIDDETELLLPDNLLRTDSVIAKLVASIEEDDWKEVEIIGWLYQFYISEKKDEVIGKVVKSEDIPAATQLFTPNWIVQYLVQNSVGRLWLMANPASTLQAQWPYYIAPADQTPEVQAQLDALIQTRVDEDGDSLNPESITLLDPACGSGHILVEAYDVLKAIYLERGYQPRAIPRLILEKNLYGLDIDDRAAQMAGFALLMKARADDRRLFNEPVKLKVLSLQDSKGLNVDELSLALQSVMEHRGFDESNDSARNLILELISNFANAKTFGSLIRISPALSGQLVVLESHLRLALQSGDLYAKAAAQDLLPLVQQALLLEMQFDSVVANPPYMGKHGMNTLLKAFGADNYAAGKSDLYAMFMLRGILQLKPSGYLAQVNMQGWMFLSSFESLRSEIFKSNSLITMAHLGARAFEEISGEIVQTTAFVMSNSYVDALRAVFIRLTDGESKEKQAALLEHAPDRTFVVTLNALLNIPGQPLAYWTPWKYLSVFESATKMAGVVVARQGLVTADNEAFVRTWQEVSYAASNFSSSTRSDAKNTKKKWFPYNKGGSQRKWYGNNDYVVNWQDDGADIKNKKQSDLDAGRITANNSKCWNQEYYFQKCISWSGISSGAPGFREYTAGSIFSGAGLSAFFDDSNRDEAHGFLNSKLCQELLTIISPGLSLTSGEFGRLPYLTVQGGNRSIVQALVRISREDWDSYETSWNYQGHWLADNASKCKNLQHGFDLWTQQVHERIATAKLLEEDNNRLFIDTYGLQDELSPDVPESQITLARADREKDSQRLVSYALGCMMGRYSLDAPGLIYANAGNVGFDDTRYASFPADADGIVPLTDDLWFEDEAAIRIREFLLVEWGAETLAENMAWLAESLGAKAGETPDETIRRYLADKFYKDHLQTYKKRPIYWLFSSGKQGAFQALVYLHRYHEGTLARMRAEYVVPLTGKIQSRIDMLEKDAAAAASTAARNKLAKEVEKLKKKHVELLAYDEQLRHHADMRITLDLDDGVKVNYGKFGNLLAEVKAVTGGASDD